MQLWQPSAVEPEQEEWWEPLRAVRCRAETERVSSPPRPEEFRFRGRVDRGRLPPVWIYEHRGSGREIVADGRGRTYEFIRYRTGCQLGRFNEIGVWPAVVRVRLGRDGARGHWTIRRGHLSLVPPLPNLN